MDESPDQDTAPLPPWAWADTAAAWERHQRLTIEFVPIIDVMPRSVREARLLVEMDDTNEPITFRPGFGKGAGAQLTPSYEPADDTRLFMFTAWLDPDAHQLRTEMLRGVRGDGIELDVPAAFEADYFGDGSVHVRASLTPAECAHLFEVLGNGQPRASYHLAVRAFPQDPGLGRYCLTDLELFVYGPSRPIPAGDDRLMFFGLVDDGMTATAAVDKIEDWRKDVR